MRRVVITGLGVVAPNGIGKEAFWSACANGTSGVDWSQAAGIGRSLLFSPLTGFVVLQFAAALLLLALLLGAP